MQPWHAAKGLGNECYRAGRFEDAIEKWTVALELVPDDLKDPESISVLTTASAVDNSNAAVD